MEIKEIKELEKQLSVPEYYKINGKDIMSTIIAIVDKVVDTTEEKFYLSNVFKYLIRHKNKNKVSDLNKAKDYINRLIIEEYYNENK